MRLQSCLMDIIVSGYGQYYALNTRALVFTVVFMRPLAETIRLLTLC